MTTDLSPPLALLEECESIRMKSIRRSWSSATRRACDGVCRPAHRCGPSEGAGRAGTRAQRQCSRTLDNPYMVAHMPTPLAAAKRKRFSRIRAPSHRRLRRRPPRPRPTCRLGRYPPPLSTVLAAAFGRTRCRIHPDYPAGLAGMDRGLGQGVVFRISTYRRSTALIAVWYPFPLLLK